MLKSVVLSFVVALIAPNSAATKVPLAKQAQVETIRTVRGELARSVNGLLASHPEFSGALLIEVGDATVLDAGYGYADREARQPFDTTTVAQIGSLTKQFTAVLILGLRTQGLIDESKTLKTYLPGTAEPAASATIEELLTHTSGLAENCTDSDFTLVTLDRLKTFCAAKPLANPRGRFRYSNLGFSFLAAVVQRLSGRPFETSLQDTILTPYRLHRSGYSFSQADMQRWTFAKGYDGSESQENIAITLGKMSGNYWNLKGNGGMQASASDMLRWYHAIRSAEEFKPLREDLRHPIARNALGTFYADGWFIRTDKAGKPSNIFHSGSDGTFLTYLGWWPQTNRVLYYVSNYGTARSVVVLKKILDLMAA